LEKSTTYEVPHYAVFSNFLSKFVVIYMYMWEIKHKPACLIQQNKSAVSLCRLANPHGI
jgi:hypothetical protein